MRGADLRPRTTCVVKFLLDTNIISEAVRSRPESRVLRWLRKNEKDVALDSIVLGEIAFGIQVLPAGGRRRKLDAWFEARCLTLVCLPWDRESALCWGALMSRLKSSGAVMPLKDSFIAASAIRYRLTLATRNIADFQAANIRLVNPFEG